MEGALWSLSVLLALSVCWMKENNVEHQPPAHSLLGSKEVCATISLKAALWERHQAALYSSSLSGLSSADGSYLIPCHSVWILEILRYQLCNSVSVCNSAVKDSRIISSYHRKYFEFHYCSLTCITPTLFKVLALECEYSINCVKLVSKTKRD